MNKLRVELLGQKVKSSNIKSAVSQEWRGIEGLVQAMFAPPGELLIKYSLSHMNTADKYTLDCSHSLVDISQHSAL